MLQWFIRFPEFSEFLFHLGKTQFLPFHHERDFFLHGEVGVDLYSVVVIPQGIGFLPVFLREQRTVIQRLCRNTANKMLPLV